MNEWKNVLGIETVSQNCPVYAKMHGLYYLHPAPYSLTTHPMLSLVNQSVIEWGQS